MAFQHAPPREGRAADNRRAAQQRAAPRPRAHAWPLLRVGTGIMAAGTVAVILAADNVLVRPGWFSLFSLYNVLAFGGRRAALAEAAALESRRGAAARDHRADGSGGLQGSSSPFAHSLGVLADPILTIVWIYLLLTFPTIRLDRASATVLAILVATVAIAFVPWFFFSKHVSGATPLARCTAACPENPFMIADRPGAAALFSDIVSFGRTFFAVLLSPARHPPLLRLGTAPSRPLPALRDRRHVGRRFRRLRRGHGPDRNQPASARHDRLVADGYAHRDPTRRSHCRSSSSVRSRGSRPRG